MKKKPWINDDGKIYCPVNGYDCPYFKDDICTLENVEVECDDFYYFWGDEVEEEEIEEESEEEEKMFNFKIEIKGSIDIAEIVDRMLEDVDNVFCEETDNLDTSDLDNDTYNALLEAIATEVLKRKM